VGRGGWAGGWKVLLCPGKAGGGGGGSKREADGREGARVKGVRKELGLKRGGICSEELSFIGGEGRKWA